MNTKKWVPEKTYDFLIIGSGMGGSSLAYGLKDSGKQVLLVEQGGFIPQEKANWSLDEIVRHKKYASTEKWLDATGNTFTPRIYYNVGGNTRFFGASSFRLRESDFKEWPVSYSEMAPWYARAESLMGVRGLEGEDITAPEGTTYTLPAVEHEAVIENLSERLKQQGLHPFHLPVAVDSGPKGRCRKGSPCDGFPCMVRAKGDAEKAFLRPQLLSSDSALTLLTEARVEKLLISEDGKSVSGAEIIHEGKKYIQKADTVIVSAGAVNSARLLLQSACPSHPGGLANSSGMVGRNYMAHHNTVLLALNPFRYNATVFQKTLAVNDFYERGWGCIQMRGKIHREMLENRSQGILRSMAPFIAPRSLDLWLMTEDLPDSQNRVTVTESGQLQLTVKKRSNLPAHEQLIKAAATMMRKAGYPVVFRDSRGIEAVQHQCGTIRFGSDPSDSVLDKWCKTHDVTNLYVVDGSFFPTSGAVNPALTIAAQGLRIAQHLLD